MAKVLNPLNSSEARGRVGGLVYNTWRGIRTVKTHTDPAHQDDPKRQAHKNVVQAAGLRWQTLTDLQRAAWHHYANEHPDLDWTGRPLRLAGFHWYVRIQVRMIDAGWDYIDDPPSDFCRLTINVFTAEQVGNLVRLVWDLPITDPLDEYQIAFFRTKPLSPGRNPTLHDAYYLQYALYAWGTIDDEGPAPGTYTYWARPIRINGTVATWLKARVTFTGA